jgi:hypothetical protein
MRKAGRTGKGGIANSGGAQLNRPPVVRNLLVIEVPNARHVRRVSLTLRPGNNFSVEFRRELKTYAAAHDLKLNKLLALSFQTYRRQHGD